MFVNCVPLTGAFEKGMQIGDVTASNRKFIQHYTILCVSDNIIGVEIILNQINNGRSIRLNSAENGFKKKPNY